MVKRRLLPLFTIGVLGMAVLVGAQPASMVLRLDNPQLVGRSHLVVYGHVTAVKSGEKTQVALVAVECSLKGAPGKQVAVTFSPGLEDSPVFEAGETVLLFLTEVASGRFQTTGGEQGKFSFGKGQTARPVGPPPRPR